MTGLDTNIVVRLIARDDRTPLERARRLVTSTICYLPDTVLLEVAWVLRSTYGAARQQIHAELMAVLGLPNVRIADAERIRLALDWYAEGLDFADALHLASAQHADAIVTFDRRFIQRAGGKGVCPVKEPEAS